MSISNEILFDKVNLLKINFNECIAMLEKWLNYNDYIPLITPYRDEFISIANGDYKYDLTIYEPSNNNFFLKHKEILKFCNDVRYGNIQDAIITKRNEVKKMILELY